MTQSQSPSSSSSSSNNDYHTQWCPVCDRQIVPKRTQVPIPPDPPVLPPYVHSQRKRRGFLEGTTSQLKQAQALALASKQQPQRLRTIIDQGPCPLYCSEECRMRDTGITSRPSWHGDEDTYPTYSLYPLTANNSSGSDPDESDSVSTSSASDSLPSPTEELGSNKSSYSPFNFKPSSSPATSAPSLINAIASTSPLSGVDGDDFLPLVPVRRPFVTTEQRSKSFQHRPSTTASAAATPRYRNHSCERSSPSSLPANTDELLSKFSLSFSRRSESRVSLYSGIGTPDHCSPAPLSSSPSRRPVAAHGLLVPEILTTTRPSSRPPPTRRNSSTSIISNRSRTGSMASVGSSRPSIQSPLGQYGSDDSDLEEQDEEEAPRSPSSVSGYPNPLGRRPVLETRSWSNDNFKTVTAPKSRRTPSSRPDGKRLFLFPTD
ncbi:hypothetical protein Moror_12468 [Moniliophthora roreri MCA 2997]|uniref:Uncharacterized protein n=2 Tax=Moniliophthora roreri TaxID=221103 RepID=V2YVN1_MONRO|nr:hypothetical protein Moror_12468 [Moniliophthora roreri MCA 2997]KAI3616234.1 hypothetical protein WG66_014044 [Moniliophthora roreri]